MFSFGDDDNVVLSSPTFSVIWVIICPDSVVICIWAQRTWVVKKNRHVRKIKMPRLPWKTKKYKLLSASKKWTLRKSVSVLVCRVRSHFFMLALSIYLCRLVTEYESNRDRNRIEKHQQTTTTSTTKKKTRSRKVMMLAFGTHQTTKKGEEEDDGDEEGEEAAAVVVEEKRVSPSELQLDRPTSRGSESVIRCSLRYEELV